MSYWQPLSQEKFGTNAENHLKQIKDISFTLVPRCFLMSLFMEIRFLRQTRVCIKVFQVIREPSSSNYKAVFKDCPTQLQWKNRGLYKELGNMHVFVRV